MTLTADQWLDLELVGIRSASFRFDLVDTFGGTIGQVHPVEPWPTVSVDTTRTIKRDLRGLVLPPSELAAISPAADRVRPVTIMPDGSEYPMGVVVFVGATDAPHSYGNLFTGALLDQCWVVDQPMTAGVSLATGASIHDAIVEALSGLPGIIGFTVDDTGATIGTAVHWPIGTSRLAYVNDLCAKAGCFDLYFDNTGWGRVRAVPSDLTLITPTVVYVEGEPGAGGGIGNIIEGTTLVTENYLSSANRFVAIDSSAQTDPIVGIYNIPASAPNSFAARGEYVTVVVNEQGLANVDAAVAAARAAAAKSAANFLWVSFQGVIDPRHDTYDVLEVRGILYREQKWSVTLQEGAPMSHDVLGLYA